jgi:hypothetical protein
VRLRHPCSHSTTKLPVRISPTCRAKQCCVYSSMRRGGILLHCFRPAQYCFLWQMWVGIGFVTHFHDEDRASLGKGLNQIWGSQGWPQPRPLLLYFWRSSTGNVSIRTNFHGTRNLGSSSLVIHHEAVSWEQGWQSWSRVPLQAQPFTHEGHGLAFSSVKYMLEYGRKTSFLLEENLRLLNQ